MNATLPNFPDNWTYAHAVCYTYFAFAELTDGELANDEMSVIKTKVAEWDISDDTCREAYEFFCGKSYQVTSGLVDLCWNSILSFDGYSMEHKRAMIADLKSIANADGKITDGEATAIATLEASLTNEQNA